MLPVKFVEICSTVAKKKSKMSRGYRLTKRPGVGVGLIRNSYMTLGARPYRSTFFFQAACICTCRHKFDWNIVECGVLSYQFNKPTNKRICLSTSETRTTILVFWLAEKTKCWVLASCQVWLNSVQLLQRSRKCFSKSEARAAIFVFCSIRITNLAEDVNFLLHFRFRWILSSGCRGEARRKCLRQSEARATVLGFGSTKKSTNVIEDVEILLPFKFRWILSNVCTEEV